MLVILTIENNIPTGWFAATDADDARRKAEGRMLPDLAASLYRAPFPLAAGKYQIAPGTWVLVD